MFNFITFNFPNVTCHGNSCYLIYAYALMQLRILKDSPLPKCDFTVTVCYSLMT